MEIESQMAADRERATADKQREAERSNPARRKREVEVGSVVRRPTVGPKRVGGMVSSSSSSSVRNGANGASSRGSGGSVVRKPVVPRRPGRAF